MDHVCPSYEAPIDNNSSAATNQIFPSFSWWLPTIRMYGQQTTPQNGSFGFVAEIQHGALLEERIYSSTLPAISVIHVLFPSVVMPFQDLGGKERDLPR
jgi:hypothetical protein